MICCKRLRRVWVEKWEPQMADFDDISSNGIWRLFRLVIMTHASNYWRGMPSQELVERAAHLVQDKCVQVGHVSLVRHRPLIIIFKVFLKCHWIVRDFHHSTQVMWENLQNTKRMWLWINLSYSYILLSISHSSLWNMPTPRLKVYQHTTQFDIQQCQVQHTVIQYGIFILKARLTHQTTRAQATRLPIIWARMNINVHHLLSRYII